MDAYKIAVPVILVSILTGLSAGIFLNPEISSVEFDLNAPSFLEGGLTEKSQNTEIGPLRSAHDHASFHVVVNGSEKDFTDRKFQLNSRYVHLENNKSDIVHKHATGVTWKMFFQTINFSTSTQNGELCLEIYGNKSCGEGAVVLNGEFNASLNQEISQDDNLLIILDTKDWRVTSEEYMQKELPEDYRPQKPEGRSI